MIPELLEAPADAFGVAGGSEFYEELLRSPQLPDSLGVLIQLPSKKGAGFEDEGLVHAGAGSGGELGGAIEGLKREPIRNAPHSDQRTGVGHLSADASDIEAGTLGQTHGFFGTFERTFEIPIAAVRFRAVRQVLAHESGAAQPLLVDAFVPAIEFRDRFVNSIRKKQRTPNVGRCLCGPEGLLELMVFPGP